MRKTRLMPIVPMAYGGNVTKKGLGLRRKLLAGGPPDEDTSGTDPVTGGPVDGGFTVGKGVSTYNWTDPTIPPAPTGPNPPVDWKGMAGKAADAILPYASNIVNSFRTPPQPATPSLISPVTLSKIRLDASRNQVRNAARAQDLNADRSLDEQSAAAVRSSNLAKTLNQEGQISEQEGFLNARQRAEAAGMNLNVDAMNTGAINKQKDEMVQRQLAIQREQSGNLANATDKAIGIRNERSKANLDLQKLQTLSQMWKESGVYDRMMKRIKTEGVKDPTGVYGQMGWLGDAMGEVKAMGGTLSSPMIGKHPTHASELHRGKIGMRKVFADGGGPIKPVAQMSDAEVHTALHRPLTLPPDLIKVNDTRRVHPVSGKPMEAGHNSTVVSSDILKSIVSQAKSKGVDPNNALAVALQESEFGNAGRKNTSAFGPQIQQAEYESRMTSLGQAHAYFPDAGIDSPIDQGANSLAKALKEKTAYAQQLGLKGDAYALQAYNGLGKIGTNGKPRDTVYGVDITRDHPLDMRQNPAYGKTVMSLRDSVIKTNPAIEDIVDKTPAYTAKAFGGYRSSLAKGYLSPLGNTRSIGMGPGIMKDKYNPKHISHVPHNMLAMGGPKTDGSGDNLTWTNYGDATPDVYADGGELDMFNKRYLQQPASAGTIKIGGRDVDRGTAAGIVQSSRRNGVDPYTALSISQQESGIDKDAPFHLNPDYYGAAFAGPDAGVKSIGAQMQYADRLQRKGAVPAGEASRIQGYNGYGTIKRGHADLEGATSIYGHNIPSSGINLKQNPLYGKRILGIRGHMQANPEVSHFVDSTYHDLRMRDGGPWQEEWALGGLKPLLVDHSMWKEPYKENALTNNDPNPYMAMGGNTGFDFSGETTARDMSMWNRKQWTDESVGNGEYKSGGWISKAVNPAHKGYCTPMTKSTCAPRRKAFAMTMKKHHGFHAMGGALKLKSVC